MVALVTLVAVEASAVALLARLGASAPFDLPLDADAWAAGHTGRRARGRAPLGRARRGRAGSSPSPSRRSSPPRSPARGRRRAARTVLHAARRAAARSGSSSSRRWSAGWRSASSPFPAVAHATTGGDPPVVTVVRDGRAGDLTSLPGVDPVGGDRTTGGPGHRVGDADPADRADRHADRGVRAWYGHAVGRGSRVRRAPAVPARSWSHRASTSGSSPPARSPSRAAWPATRWPTPTSRPTGSRCATSNRGRLASGDVNVVYPGETVVLPPLA